MSAISAIRAALPQPLRSWLKLKVDAVRGRQPEWEYLPDGWRSPSLGATSGWNERSVVDMYKTHWPSFERHMRGTGPMGFWYEVGDTGAVDIVAHNIYMSYAYALGRAAHRRDTLSLLDWGGGIGHYYRVSQRLMPDLALEYHCKDMPALIEYGRTLFPEAAFYADETCLERQYDLVLASSSLHYSEDWRGLLGRLARATRGYLFISRAPVVQQAPSFVFVQRPYRFGYKTELVSWCLNQGALLAEAEAHGLRLVHECVLGEAPAIVGAPEPNMYRGFLFQAGPAQA